MKLDEGGCCDIQKLFCKISIDSANYRCKQSDADVSPTLKGGESLSPVQNICTIPWSVSASCFWAWITEV